MNQTYAIPTQFIELLPELVQAADYAVLTNHSIWHYAIEIDAFLSAKVTRTDLRLLIYRGLIEQRYESTKEGEKTRRFIDGAGVKLSVHSCFVLTPDGLRVAREVLNVPSRETPAQPLEYAEIPEWNPENRELYFDGHLVKRFRTRANNQERVLSAFQEEQWPSRIDDPLPPAPGQSSSQRLRDTIKCLNRRHHVSRVRFHCDGTGQGVLWRKVG